ncbi:MAG TPA: hypothetical protein PLR99_22935 [Polyangiaceae bacterium]|jgi:hypothetical protein|nr:hypothetical protein [Polyangiaceae bacterium]
MESAGRRWGWDAWKKSFDAWEERTAKHIELGLRSPTFITPASAALTTVLRAKVVVDRAQTALVAALGLPTKADQERTLHALNRLESRLIDLEEKLERADPGARKEN